MKLQLKRSSTTTGDVNAVVPVGPTAAQTLPGELCVNFNPGDPALFIEDTAGNIVRVDGNTDTYALSTTTNASQGDIVLTHNGTGNNTATTDTVSIVAGTNIAVSSNGTDITIASSVPSSGQFGYWTRNSTTLSPVNANDNVNIGSGQFTTSVGYNGPLLTNNGSDLTVSTTGTGNNNIHLDTVGTGQVQINTDVVIENEHSLILRELSTNGSHQVAHKAATSLTEDATYTWPIAPTASAYLTSDTSGNLSWTTGTTILTTVVGGAGLDATGTSGSSTTVSVDLKANQGLRTIASGSLADATDDDSELGLIAGSNAQDTLLWTVTGGAAAITPAGASGQTTEPEGAYVGVTTDAAAGSGCTVNFDVAADGTISNLTIANPGSGYGESQVLTIVGHQTSAPAPITFTLETDANNGRYTYTGWRTGALTTGGGGGSGGDLTGIDGGPGIEIDESNTTTPKVSIDLAATNPGLEFSTTGDTGELQVKDYYGITVDGNGVSVDAHNGITVNADGVSVDAHNGITVNGDGVSVTAYNGIEVNSNGVSTRIHTGGGLSDTLNTNELGLADPDTPGTSNQVVVWKAANSAQTIAVAAAPNNVSDQPEADYIDVATTVNVGAGSGLTVNFTVGALGVISNLSISNPGSGYDEATPVCSVDGHGNLNVTITNKYATAQWIAEPFSGGGSGGGGGDVTGVDAGDGINVSTGGGPEPVVSVNVHANGGLTNRFDSTVAANAGELGLVQGTADGQVMMWDNTSASWSPQTNVVNTNTTYDLSNQSVANGSQLDLTDSDGGTDSVQILGSGDTTVTHRDGTITISSTNTADTNTTYDLNNTSINGGSRLDLTDSGGTTDSVSITGSNTLSVTHNSGTISLNTVVTNGLQNTDNGLTVTASNGIEVTASGVSTNIYDIGGLSDTLGTNNSQLGLAPPADANTSNQTYVWKAAGSVQGLPTINGTSSESEGEYLNIETTAVGPSTGSNLVVNFELDDSGNVSDLSIVNPGQDYATDDVVNVNGHAGVTLTITTIYTNARWLAEAFSGGSGGGGGSSVIAVTGGNGISVNSDVATSPVVSINALANGGISYSSTAAYIDLGATAISGIVAVDHGGTGLSSTPTAGQLLIGNGTDNDYDLATLTEGTGISIANADGSITISAASGGNNTGDIGWWDRTGTTLSPVNAGDNISTTGTITSGDLNLNQNAEIIFEGATANANETTLTVTNPTADRTITLPDATGNVTLDPGFSGADSVINYVRQVTTNAAGDGVTSVAWVADAGGDLTGLSAGNGIAITSADGPIPIVAVDADPNGGITANFNSTANVGITPGSNAGDIMVWRGADAVVALNTIAGTAPADGTYTNMPTTGGAGTGLTVGFTITSGSLPGSITVINPGSGYSNGDAITVAGTSLTCAVDGVTANARWQPGTPTSAVDDDGSAGHWTRNDGTDTLSPVVANDNVDLGTGNLTANNVNASVLQHTNNLSIQTTDNDGNISLNPNGTGVVDIDADVEIENGQELRFYEPSAGGNYVSFESPALDANNTYTLPNAYPGTAGFVLTSDTSGTLTWTAKTTNTDTDTTYDLESLNDSGAIKIRLSGSDLSTDDVTIAGSGATTVSHTGSTITISSTDTNTTNILVADGSGVDYPNPANYSEGQLWWNSDADVSKLFVLYNDPPNGEGTTEEGGLKWIEASPKPQIPSIFPDLGDNTPQVGTLDDRYLRVDALPVGNNNQIVQSTGTTTFNGAIDVNDGVSVSGGIELESNGVAHFKGISFDRGGVVAPTIGHKGFYYGNNIEAPVIVNYAETNGDDVITLRGICDSSVDGVEKIANDISIFNAAGPTNVTDTSYNSLKGFSWSNANETQQSNNSNIYGFFSNQNLPAASKINVHTYNFYAAGDAPNYFNGAIVANAARGIVIKADATSIEDFANFATNGINLEYSLTATRTTAAPLNINRGITGDTTLDDATTHQIANFRYKGTQRASIAIGTSGAELSGFTNVYSLNQDGRVLTSPTELTNATDTVKLLEPKAEGFVAETLKQQFPNAVKGTENETEAIGTLYDFDGTVLETEVTEPDASELEYTEEVETYGVATMVTRTRTWTATGTRPVYQGVDQTKLIPLLTKALQEALDKIEVLEQRLSDAGIA